MPRGHLQNLIRRSLWMLTTFQQIVNSAKYDGPGCIQPTSMMRYLPPPDSCPCCDDSQRFVRQMRLSPHRLRL